MELKRGAFIRGKVEACDLHLHNVKTIELVDVEGKKISKFQKNKKQYNLQVVPQASRHVLEWPFEPNQGTLDRIGNAPFTVQHHMQGPANPSHLKQILAT